MRMFGTLREGRVGIVTGLEITVEIDVKDGEVVRKHDVVNLI